MTRIAYVNGAYRPMAEAAIHIDDRGYQFADGVYEVLLLHGGRMVDAGPHLDRLWRSLGELRIAPPMTRPALLVVLTELARRNRINADGLLYIQVSRGVARREHAFPAHPLRPALVATARRLPPYPAQIDAWHGSAITWPDQRWARCDIKSTALLPNVLARQAAREAGATEAILYDSAGQVTEGAATSLWIVDAQGMLRTRPLDQAILPGCTRAALAALLAGAGIAFEERGFSLAELRAAHEVFLTSASSFVKPLLCVDGTKVGDGRIGPVSRTLFALLRGHVTGQRVAPAQRAA